MSDFQNRSKKNLEGLLLQDITRGQDDGLDFDEAFRSVVLDYEGFDKSQDYRDIHISDGPGDFGIDFWDIYPDSHSAVIYQFKARDIAAGLPLSQRLTPEDLTDIPRILDLLQDIDRPPTELNTKVQVFLKQLALRLHQYTSGLEADSTPPQHDLPFSIEIILAALVEDQSAQTKAELGLLRNRAASLKLNGVAYAQEVRCIGFTALQDLVEETT